MQQWPFCINSDNEATWNKQLLTRAAAGYIAQRRPWTMAGQLCPAILDWAQLEFKGTPKGWRTRRTLMQRLFSSCLVSSRAQDSVFGWSRSLHLFPLLDFATMPAPQESSTRAHPSSMSPALEHLPWSQEHLKLFQSGRHYSITAQ
jgi:hypothetical protein